MEHVGIDLGAVKSHVVRMNEKGDVVERWALRTRELESWLSRIKPSRVVMEACTQSTAVARMARRLGHEAVIVSGTLVRALGVGARGIKTDDRDAEVLARASVRNETLPSVHLRSEPSAEKRGVIQARNRLVNCRRQCSTSIKSHLRSQLLSIRGRADRKAFASNVRELLQTTPDGLPSYIETLLKTFEFLTEQIDALEVELSELAKNTEPCTKLMELPGVGPLVSLSFVTTIDDPSRFPNADSLASFLTLVPGESTTGGNIHRTGTIHAGPKWLKALLVQAAWVAWRSVPEEPMVQWAKSIGDKRGTRIAIVALARKLATVMWAMWRRHESYRPERAASTRPPSLAPTGSKMMATARP